MTRNRALLEFESTRACRFRSRRIHTLRRHLTPDRARLATMVDATFTHRITDCLQGPCQRVHTTLVRSEHASAREPEAKSESESPARCCRHPGVHRHHCIRVDEANVFGDELERCVGNCWSCHRSVGQIHAHSSTSAILFERGNVSNSGGEAGRDPIQVIGNEVTTVTEWSKSNQRKLRANRAKCTQKFLEVVAVAGPKVNYAVRSR